MTPAGLPHSEIPGSKRACRSPRLIAACCVLHRLSVPRHPPSTLSNLTIKCLDLMRSAVACLSTSLDNPTCLCISLIYNPYSIVNEPCDAEIGAAFNRSRLPAPLIIAALPAVRWTLGNRKGGAIISPRPFVRHRLVELIGFEPTTPCLQSRCSPS